MEAQFGYIHQIKMAELHRGTRRDFALHLGQQASLDLADALHAPGGGALLRSHNRGWVGPELWAAHPRGALWQIWAAQLLWAPHLGRSICLCVRPSVATHVGVRQLHQGRLALQKQGLVSDLTACARLRLHDSGSGDCT